MGQVVKTDVLGGAFLGGEDTQLALGAGQDEGIGEAVPAKVRNALAAALSGLACICVKIEKRQRQMVLTGGSDRGDLGEAFPAWQTPGRDAILQPPKPQISPAAKILQLVQERDAEPEVAD